MRQLLFGHWMRHLSAVTLGDALALRLGRPVTLDHSLACLFGHLFAMVFVVDGFAFGGVDLGALQLFGALPRVVCFALFIV